LQTVVEGVLATGDGSVRGVSTVGRGGRSVYLAAQLIDCSGDAWLPVKAGAQTVAADEAELQPVSLVYRIGPVDFERYLAFVRDNPDEFLLGENPAIGLSPAECARRAYDSGMPHVALSCDGPLLGGAIASGEMYPCTFVFTWPTSLARREVGLNTTRVAGIDATDDAHLSDVFADLAEQVVQGLAFGRKHLPGFDSAGLTGLASRVGVRETRRIVGEYTLTADDVISGRKRDDGIAKGSHHVDIHGSGTAQLRIPVQDGGSYDVPFGALIPVGLKNLLVAGRCLSSSREANGSARVMGTCLGTGQAAGVAAAMAVQRGIADTRDLPVNELRQSLRKMGAVLDGTH
jgi:hypothetical protein